jgi:hypothetical protein
MVTTWSGIGNIWLIAADTLRGQIQAEELGEIEPWDFFYPKKGTIKASILEDLEFPGSKFYYKRLGTDFSRPQRIGGTSGYLRWCNVFR